MKINYYQGTVQLSTSSSMELVDITRQIQCVIEQHSYQHGICHLFNPHTTAGLTINEGADPDVQTDIIRGLREIVPLHLNYRHMEGNSPSHIMASLMGCTLNILVENQKLLLGTWQKIFFCEFDGPRTRKVVYRLS